MTASPPPAQPALHPFRVAVEARDLDGMVAGLADDVRLHSPVAFRPFAGREAVRTVFANLFEVFEDFHYVDELAGQGTHALIFQARIGGREVQGLDHLRYDADGLVSEFTVMVRPLSAAIALAEAMGPRVAHLPKG
ncbi:MAG TPA: nuclear transport factor 2 family protein [Candidatus Nanopelagicales bacterium]